MGTKYQVPFALILGHEEEVLKFGSVTNIYVDGTMVYFEFIPLMTEQYYNHFHAYAIALPQNKNFLPH